MRLLRVILAIAAAVVLQAALGRFAGGVARYVDLTLLPVVWWGIRGTQRSAMLVGCAAGLAHDAWFRAAVFGLSGFKRTLLGWLLGAVGGRFDLNHAPGRFVVTVAVGAADGLLDVGLRRLLDLAHGPGTMEWLLRALTTGAAAVVIFAAVDRFRSRDGRGRLD